MKPVSIAILKKSLKQLSQEELLALVLRLGTFKVDNKALLSYLLFYENNQALYLKEVKDYIIENFAGLNQDSSFYVRKGLRKIEREINKQIKFVKDKTFEVELLICYLQAFTTIEKVHQRHLNNIYERVYLKAKTKISVLHEDLQYDFETLLNELY
jgi:DNA repair protein RadC